MSLTGAMHTALTGLRATSRMAEVAGDNVANALTDGFAKREVMVTSDVLDGRVSGVTVTGVSRKEDVIATRSRREMSTENAAAEARSNVATRMATSLGQPGQTGALASVYGQFGSALTAASNNPGTQTFLDNAVARAVDVTRELNRLSLEAQDMRETADADIALEVDRLNNALSEIERLNTEIQRRSALFSETNALQDTRQRHIDTVAELVSVRVIKRENDTVALYTEDGGKLIDGKAVEIDFARTAMITHDMTFASGALSGLTVDGVPMTSTSPGGWYDTGKLGELFAIRDTVVPEYNGQLDALARDLIERFQDPAVDPTLGAADAGLFTDAGAAFDPLNTVSLAGRISVNAAVDPSAGGEEWRLRDGLNAATSGEAGYTDILESLQSVFAAGRTGSAGMNVNGSLGAADFAAEVTSQRGYEQAYREETRVYTSTQLSILSEAEAARTGVDTDEELQRMLLIEKAYAANARVIETIDSLLSRLLEI